MAAKMTHTQGDEAIARTLENRPNDKVRKGIIDQILWCVAKGEGVELANALIWKFDLFEVFNGGHTFFECEKTAGRNYLRDDERTMDENDYNGTKKQRQYKNLAEFIEKIDGNFFGELKNEMENDDEVNSTKN